MLLPVETANYVIEFLLMQTNRNLIAYSEVPATSQITIIPAREVSEPVLPGNIRVSHSSNGIVIHDDIVMSTFFLLSRYDEYLQPDALDGFSRFMSDRSFLGSHGLLQTPVIDLYTEFIYNLLNQPVPHRKRHKYLTHDIDTVSHYHRLRGFCGGVFRSVFKRDVSDSLSTVIASAFDIEKDPAYNFKVIEELDSRFPDGEVIYFVKPDRARNRYDRPAYPLSSLPKLNGAIGLHSLYETYDNVSLLKESAIPHKYHRSHYLRVLKPTEMHHYVDAGITDDFSLGYANAPGFRLGTTRPSKVINPATAEVLPLTIHPLTIMDTTLIDSRYLNLDYSHALELCLSMFRTIDRYQGDINLLFHNNTFANPLIAKIYPELLSHL